MFIEVLLFELRYHLKSRLFLFGCAVFFLLAFLGVASPNVQFGALGGANYNSPFAILQTHVFLGMIGVLVGAAVVLGPVFCGWICPLGLILDLNDAARRRVRIFTCSRSARIRDRELRPSRR